MEKIPVLVYTDIGDDIDDALALVYLLWTSNIDVVGIICGYKKIAYRTSIAAHIIEGLNKNTPILWWFENQRNHKRLSIFLEETLKKYAADLVILSIAPNGDLYKSMLLFPNLFAKIRCIYFQWQVCQKEDKIFPDLQGYNFAQEPDAISQIMKQDIPMIFVSKYLAYQIPLYHEDFDILARQNNPIWWYLKEYAHTRKRRLKKLNSVVFHRLFGVEKKDILSYPYDMLTAACISNPEMFIPRSIGNRIIIWDDPDKASIYDKHVLKNHLIEQMVNALK